ncbi:histidine kinase N-terminal 7TM domain-containing protein [Halorientalis pallida]|uniref:histidine kinase n=1 Tax=Halorientalis pallida TaxID=2479928 RepID=A0A498L5H0_9EURY|nr:histidine kinase N-terminal 7TM domain-containing protein [Halorientalis pallida]RXK51512.1 PAS domain S-box protein [Halorientalis pallida]
MELQATPYTVPLALAVVVGTVGAAISWHQREGPLEVSAMGVQLSLALWSLFTLLTVSAVSLFWKQLWFALFLPTIPLLVVTTSLFTVHFVGRRDWLTRPRVGALLTFPLVTLGLTLTNGIHGLFLVDVGVDRSGSFAMLTYEFGIGVKAMAAISYAVAIGYNTVLARRIARSRNVYRKISAVISLSTLAIGVVTILSLTKLSPFPHFMLVPFVYVVVGVFLLSMGSVTFIRALPFDRIFSIVESRLDNTVPLARDFVLEAVDNGIIVVDEDGRIVDVNSTAKRMLGLNRPVGKPLTTVVRPEWVLECGEIGPVLEGDEPVHELDDEAWVETPNGERCYQATISALSEGDEARAHVILLHDITDRKRREEQLQEQKEALRSRKQQLEHQNERLDEFAGIVSHDLRNPLNVTTSYLELFEAQIDGDDDSAEISETDIEEMRTATERMEAIIDDALTLAREGKAVTETEPVDLSETAESAWETVDTADATLRVETDTVIEADRGRLRTIFENLTRNAVEHGSTSPASQTRQDAVEHGSTSPASQTRQDAVEHGRENVTVTVGDFDHDDAAGFFVADDGPGIPDDRKREVLDHGFTTSEGGTGFGLAIVTDAANAHGWDVTVTDSETAGARFEFTGVDRVNDDSRTDG